MTQDDLEGHAFFTITGKDIWRLESYYLTPSCSLVNLETKEIKSFGLGGITAESFKRIIMPVKPTP